MIKIKCEMCGSSDMIKEDSLYVCNNCGMKYSPEEAKKMMVEIEGAVKIDHSEELANLYVLARRAKNNNDFSEALKYYSVILSKNPMDWEAVFFTLIFDHTEKVLAETEQSCTKILNGIPSVIALVKDTVENDEERRNAYSEAVRYTVWATRNIHAATQKNENIFRDRRSQILVYLSNILYTFANEVRNNFPNGEYVDFVIYSIKQGLQFQSIVITDYPQFNNEEERAAYFSWAEDVKKYDANFVIPEIPALTAQEIEKENLKIETEAAEIRQKEIKKEMAASTIKNIIMFIVIVAIIFALFFLAPKIFMWLLETGLNGISDFLGI